MIEGVMSTGLMVASLADYMVVEKNEDGKYDNGTFWQVKGRAYGSPRDAACRSRVQRENFNMTLPSVLNG
jgi:hypothetical protein